MPIVIVAAAGVVLAWWLTRPRLSDAEQIGLVVDQIKAGLEKKSPREVLTHISADYHDSEGINYARAKFLASRLLREPEQIEINILNYTGPVIAQDLAELKLTVNASALSSGARVAQVSGEVKLTFRKERKGWKVLDAEGWQQWVVGLE